MGRSMMDISTIENMEDIGRTLDICHALLPEERYKDCEKSFKKSVSQTLLIILVSGLLGVAFLILLTNIGDVQYKKVLDLYGAAETNYMTIADKNTVMYTKGESFYYDTRELEIDNVREMFPDSNRVVGLMDSNNNLKALVLGDELGSMYETYGILCLFIIPCTILTLYAILFGRTRYGRRWRIYQEFAESRDVRILDKLENKLLQGLLLDY